MSFDNIKTAVVVFMLTDTLEVVFCYMQLVHFDISTFNTWKHKYCLKGYYYPPLKALIILVTVSDTNKIK